ncbi:MAG: hypothetical protein J5511_05500 [Bacilli bacterium]|nr:hypothetical protein [Bacilli bacterium]
MKKTKILVPAMAILALGMAGAVTGTVAWYSSTNVVYAKGLTIKSTTASSLQISLEQNTGYGTVVDHSGTTGDAAYMTAAVDPAYCLDAPGTLTAAPEFVYLDKMKVDNPGSGTGEDKWYVDAAGKVRVFADNTLVAPAHAVASGENANPWVDDDPEEGTGRYTNVKSDSDWLKLDSTEENPSKTVTVKVHFSRGAEPKLIDRAMSFGFYNVNTKKWEVEKPFTGDNVSATSVDVTFTPVTVTKTPSEYIFYMWYDGEDDVTINANAIVNPIAADITYRISD